MRFERSLSFGLCLVVGGCYTFYPATRDDLAPDMRLRTRVSFAEAERLQEDLPGLEGRLIEGTILERGDSSVLLLVPIANRSAWGRNDPFLRRVQISYAGIVDLERRQLDGFRTGVAVVGGGLALGFVLYKALLGGNGGNSPDSGEGPVDALIPFSIRIGG